MSEMIKEFDHTMNLPGIFDKNHNFLQIVLRCDATTKIETAQSYQHVVSPVWKVWIPEFFGFLQKKVQSIQCRTKWGRKRGHSWNADVKYIANGFSTKQLSSQAHLLVGNFDVFLEIFDFSNFSRKPNTRTRLIEKVCIWVHHFCEIYISLRFYSHGSHLIQSLVRSKVVLTTCQRTRLCEMPYEINHAIW